MTGIMLGNLSTAQIQERAGIKLSPRDAEALEKMRVNNATVKEGEWHGFDLPFAIQCGDKETAEKVVSILTPYASEFKCQMQITY